MVIYILDIIGKHSGAHFYNKRLLDTLKMKYKKVRIISNYVDPDDNFPAILENFYEGNSLIKILKLIKSLFKYYFFILKNSKNYFVFLSYGNAFEILFFWPLLFCRKRIIDVHEVISLIDNNRIQNAIRKRIAMLLYNHIADAAIIHSARSETLLNELDYKKSRLYIPHFSYYADKTFIENNISSEVRSLILADKINILFFGFVRLSKGIETIIHIAEKSETFELGNRINLIIAGNDPDNIVKSLSKDNENKCPGSISILLRYISDNELKYLFEGTDFIILPYKQISQSGVLEMAVNFRKPVITSSLDYFRSFLESFPSFGIFCENDSVDGFINLLDNISHYHNKMLDMFYQDHDQKKYNEYKNPEKFLNDLEVFFPVSKQV